MTTHTQIQYQRSVCSYDDSECALRPNDDPFKKPNTTVVSLRDRTVCSPLLLDLLDVLDADRTAPTRREWTRLLACWASSRNDQRLQRKYGQLSCDTQTSSSDGECIIMHSYARHINTFVAHLTGKNIESQSLEIIQTIISYIYIYI